MNIVIFEDEPAAARHMQMLIAQLPFDVQVLAVLDTVRNAISWLQNYKPPDLFVSDVQLADGSSLKVFETISIMAPIIFTTAYDEYMQQAFRLNSIDYLLKPIDAEALKQAFEKHRTLQRQYSDQANDRLQQFIRHTHSLPAETFKSRFLVRNGNQLSTVAVNDVRLLQADDRIVRLYDHAGRKFILDESLDDLERILNPRHFFRLNRKYLVPIEAIEKIEKASHGKWHVRLKNCDDKEVLVSRERAKSFKNWLDGM